MFILSVALSLLLHFLLIRYAADITLVQASSEPPALLRRFDVELVSIAASPAPAAPRPDPQAEALAAPPPPLEPIPPAPSLMEPAAIPALEERLDSGDIDRAFDAASAEQAAAVDARILAIEQEAARREIEVARVFVAPGAERLLNDGETPVLRGSADMLADDLLLVDPLAGALGLGPSPAVIAGPDAGAGLEPPLLPPGMSEGLPSLPAEEAAVRAPILNAIAAENDAESMDDLMAFELSTYVPPGGSEGYYRLRIVPRPGAAEHRLPKDLTFVVDASSSIVQRKLDLTARGIGASLAKLRPDDRFNVILFRDTATAFRPEPVPATGENVKAALDFLQGIQSRGETNVYTALDPVVQRNPPVGQPGVVVVVSDGRPTTGLQDARAIINAVTDGNDLTNSIFAVTAGRTVNRYMLDLLAYRNKGEAVVSDDIESLSGLLPEFVDTIRDPLLVNIDARFSEGADAAIFPKSLPDLYASRALAIYGRFAPGEDEALAFRLRGEAGATSKDIVHRNAFDDALPGGPEIARGWAFQKIYHLIGEMSRVGETPELLAEVRALSRAHGIRTSYDE